MNQLESAAQVLRTKSTRFLANARTVRLNGTSRTKVDRREYAEDLEALALLLVAVAAYWEGEA